MTFLVLGMTFLVFGMTFLEFGMTSEQNKSPTKCGADTKTQNIDMNAAETGLFSIF